MRQTTGQAGRNSGTMRARTEAGVCGARRGVLVGLRLAFRPNRPPWRGRGDAQGPVGPGAIGMETDVTGTIPKTAAKLSAMILAATALLAVVAGTAGAEVVYNNVPSSLPGNFASIGFGATSSSEFGGQVRLAGKARKHPTVTVVMSSWGCLTGNVAKK